MTHDLLHWEHVLQKAGHRVTRQRTHIMDAVCAGGGHTPLGEIYHRVRQADRSIDRSTVYRALHLFVDLGLVVAADTGGDEPYYEIKRIEPHHHLVCSRCGDEREVGGATLQAMFDQIQREHRFQVRTDHLVLFGLCQRCQGQMAQGDTASSERSPPAKCPPPSDPQIPRATG